ncbi:hypothetical protein, partial [Victivallis vadensis]|uniref:hypothetical protein n=1 Tax=Victivallis vadensis TaxID=172901 RepID=UPI003AF555B0
FSNIFRRLLDYAVRQFYIHRYRGGGMRKTEILLPDSGFIADAVLLAVDLHRGMERIHPDFHQTVLLGKNHTWPDHGSNHGGGTS